MSGDVFEVDVLAQTRCLGQMHEAVRIHRVGQAAQVGGRLVVVEEGVEQAAFVPPAVGGSCGW